jgi:DNA-binding FrmR family transcriptional regulator
MGGMSHVNDPEIHKRLRRAEGHLGTVVQMVADGKDGLAIAQQMQAVISALEKAKQLLIVDHIDHHLSDDGGSLTPELREKLSVFREIIKYL